MRLTDVMSNLHLAIYPILALPLFVGVFVAVVVRMVRRTSRQELDRAGQLPLEEGLPVRNRHMPQEHYTATGTSQHAQHALEAAP